MTEYTATMKDWRVDDMGEWVTVVGVCVGDSKGRFDDGDIIRTSRVEVLNIQDGFVKTRNSLYKLIGKS